MARRWLSGRRLLLIVRHLPPTSAVARVLGQDWTVADDLADEVRRGVWSLVNKADVPMHPYRPAAKVLAAQEEAKAKRRAAKRAESERREAERQRRLRERGGAA